MMPVKVECYAARKADERPMRFQLGDRSHFVEEVVDQWYGPDGEYFKVRADDANVYVLRHDNTTDEWSAARRSIEVSRFYRKPRAPADSLEHLMRPDSAGESCAILHLCA